MERALMEDLIKWKNTADRYPLLVRGPRQVGKSYLIERFAKEQFKDFVVIDFELQPRLKECFDDLDPQSIINKIRIVLGVDIDRKETLIFLDEIQECPRAIMALRYFREKTPQLPVIGAGSLLEFALQGEDFKFPVGRVQFLYLEPLSFSEFLSASGNINLKDYLSNITPTGKIDKVIHDKLIELLKQCLIVGGMPAVLNEYFTSGNIKNCLNIQSSLLQTYRSDFGKYARSTQHKYLIKVFDAAPRLIGQRIKYVNIDKDFKSRDLKSALNLLVLAGIVKPILATSASGLPLAAQINEQKFKLNFMDTGLMQNACGLQADITLASDVMQVNSGAVTEQFCGQELRAYSDSGRPNELFFWARDKKNSSAEVDYVVSVGSNIIPIEVKAGMAGKLRSLRIFMEEKKARLGIKISQDELSFTDDLLSVPLYMIEQIPRIVDYVLNNPASKTCSLKTQ